MTPPTSHEVASFAPHCSLQEAAKRIYVTESWLRRAANAGKVPHLRLGNRIRFTDANLTEILTAATRTSGGAK